MGGRPAGRQAGRLTGRLAVSWVGADSTAPPTRKEHTVPAATITFSDRLTGCCDCGDCGGGDCCSAAEGDTGWLGLGDPAGAELKSNGDSMRWLLCSAGEAPGAPCGKDCSCWPSLPFAICAPPPPPPPPSDMRLKLAPRRWWALLLQGRSPELAPGVLLRGRPVADALKNRPPAGRWFAKG